MGNVPIYYLGERVYPRDRRGRFRRPQRLVCVVLVVIVASICAWAAAGEVWVTKEMRLMKEASVPVAYADITLKAKVDALKENVLNRLMECESGGYSEDDGIIILDANGKHSIGQMQFQKDTIVHYYKKLYGQTITKKEAVLIALDTKKAYSLAHDIIWGEVGGIWNWEICAKKLNLAPEIAVIRKLLET